MMATTTSNATPTPAMPPAPGTASDFNQLASRKGLMNIAIGVAIPLTSVFFLLRTYVRIWIKRQWTGEDCERFPGAQNSWEWVTRMADKQIRARLDCLGKCRLSVVP